MKEYSNYLSTLYGEGTEARNLPETKRVFTETELQGALRMALLARGIRLTEAGELKKEPGKGKVA